MNYKPRILTKTLCCSTVEWFRYIITVFLFSPPWRWQRKWAKHVDDYCVIKLCSYINKVQSSVSLNNFVHLIKTRNMEHIKLTHSFLPDPSALVAEGTRLLDDKPLRPTVCKFVF